MNEKRVELISLLLSSEAIYYLRTRTDGVKECTEGMNADGERNREEGHWIGRSTPVVVVVVVHLASEIVICLD